MAASKEDIAQWFDEGMYKGATHMLVIVDTFDHSDFPIYAYSRAEAYEMEKAYARDDAMMDVMEVYNLDADKTEQLAQFRCFNY